MKALAQWWKVHFLAAEMGLAVLAGVAFAVWAVWLGGQPLVDVALKGNRAAVYGTLASICGSLLGFTIAAVAIVLGYASSDRLAIVRESRHYLTLWHVFVAAMRAMGTATLVALVGLILDRDGAPVPVILYVCVGTTTLAALRLARCLWVLEQAIALVAAPSKEQVGDRM